MIRYFAVALLGVLMGISHHHSPAGIRIVNILIFIAWAVACMFYMSTAKFKGNEVDYDIMGLTAFMITIGILKYAMA